MKKVLVVGGGAAGMLTGIFAAENGAEVSLYEQNEKLGKKLFITGKGRCNLTNDCPEEEFLNHIVTNPKFLYSAFNQFNNHDMIQLIEKLHVPTKVERGGRVFPVSDHSSDVIRALERHLRELGADIFLNTRVKSVLTKAQETEQPKIPGEKAYGLLLENGETVSGDEVVIATGGISYPSTGATGDGYQFAKELGMKVTELRPALVPLLTAEEYIPRLQGLSLKNVTLTICYGKKGKKIFQEFGEMMFTHEGITGPLVLSASSIVGKWAEENPLEARIDLKPALSEEQLDARLLREFDQAKNKQFKTAVGGLYPAKLRPVILELCGMLPELPVHEVTKEDRKRVIRLTKAFPLTITGTGTFNQAIITQGGVSVKEIQPKTMESKKVSDLYFVGEVLDVDAVTGGYNLQVAWSTAAACASAMTKSESV
jgi:predicted Rossmann fold flavoprotein